MALRLTLSIETAPETLRHLSELSLVATFENRTKKIVSVLIDATPLSHGRYTLEFTAETGRPVRPDSFEMCGTIAPLQEHEIADVKPGESFRTAVHTDRMRLPPGTYRARVRYHAHKSDRGADSLSPVVATRLKHFWTGTLLSDWLPLTLQA